MTNLKNHFSTPTGAACGRVVRKITTVTSQVTCGTCRQSEQFAKSDARQALAKRQAFEAQTPRTVAEPWRAGSMVCSTCGGTTFRDAGRTCYGHYDNYVCASCGHNESRLTETGMSF